MLMSRSCGSHGTTKGNFLDLRHRLGGRGALRAIAGTLFGMGYVIRESHEDLFVEHARTFSRVLADEFEVGAAMDSQKRIEDLLDFAITHGGARYAELNDRGRSIRSVYGSSDIKAARSTDFEFRRRRRRHLLRRAANRARVPSRRIAIGLRRAAYAGENPACTDSNALGCWRDIWPWRSPSPSF